MANFGDYLRDIREKRGFSINQLADKSGVSNAHISRLERGLRPAPSPKVIEKLAYALKVDPQEMMRVAGYLKHGNLPQGIQWPRNAWPAGSMARVPVLGVIRAGLPIYADEQLIGWEELPWEWVKDGEYFLLRVTGDSMIGDNIPPGSLVLVRRQDYVEDGKTAVVMVNSEEATVKKVRFRDGMVFLYPANPKYEPQAYPATEVKIIGKVVKTVINKE